MRLVLMMWWWGWRRGVSLRWWLLVWGCHVRGQCYPSVAKGHKVDNLVLWVTGMMSTNVNGVAWGGFIVEWNRILVLIISQVVVAGVVGGDPCVRGRSRFFMMMGERRSYWRCVVTMMVGGWGFPFRECVVLLIRGRNTHNCHITSG